MVRGFMAALAATALVAPEVPASAQKAGGTLRVTHRDNPPSASIHEEATISTVMPFMSVYNNLVVFDPNDRSRTGPTRSCPSSPPNGRGATTAPGSPSSCATA